jgi:hypothetical protein
MALYEDDTMQLREQGAPPPDPSLYELKGTMGPVGQEQEYYERKKSPTVGQEQPQGIPANMDINQFLDWAVKTQLGYNPYKMNPVTEAMKKWNTLESQAFQEVFGNSGITPNNMTPEALKHWNEQKREGLKQLIDEAKNKQATGMAYLEELRKGWGDRNAIASWVDLPSGEKAPINRFGEVVKAPSAGAQMGAPQVPGQPQGMGGGQLTQPAKTKPGKELSAEAITNIANMKSTYDRLDEIGEQVKKMEDRFGPVTGRVEEAYLKFQEDPEMQTLFNRLNSLITIAYDLSGKQISEKEMEKLQKAMLPGPNQPRGNLLATVAFVRDWLALAHNNRVKYYGAGGYATQNFPTLERGKNYNIDPKQLEKIKNTIKSMGKDKEGLSSEERLMNDDIWRGIDALGKAPRDIPAGWTVDEKGVVRNERGQKMKWKED